MARSISLAAYLALSKRTGGALPKGTGQRPEGTLIWGHATSPARVRVLVQIAERLRQHRGDVTLLLTTTPDIAQPDHLDHRVLWTPVPDEGRRPITAFLDHWKPDICLWTGGYLRPALIIETADRDTPMFLIDVDAKGFASAQSRWFPDITRACLSEFGAIMLRNHEARQPMRRLGVAEKDLTVTGPLQEGGRALFCRESEREEMAAILSGRPVWLAAMAQVDELDALIKAHRLASRTAHRLLLILVPDDETDGQEFYERLQNEGCRTAVWSEGAMPDETTQILLADTYGELGLWYRLAPVTFMGSSLVPGYGGRDPFEPAALGSAILYGPNVSRYLTAYSRFAGARAARIVKDAETLSAALIWLSAPDQAALMAVAAWDVASNGAEVTDQVIDLLQDTLDVMEAQDART